MTGLCCWTFPLENHHLYHQVLTRSPSKLILSFFGLSILQILVPSVFTVVTMAKYAQVYPEDSISTVAETILLESRMEVVDEEIVVQKEDIKLPKQVILEQQLSQSVIKRDDRFPLLDVVPKETTYIPPGTHSLQISLFSLHEIYHTKQDCVSSKLLEEDFRCHFWLKLKYKFCLFSVPLAVQSQIYVQPGIEIINTELKWQQGDVDKIMLQPSQPLPGRDDDWFVLFDTVREEAVSLPSGIQLLDVCISPEFPLKNNM